MQMNELLPCPFCGSGCLYETRRNGYCDETPTMFCNSCKAVVTWEQVEEEGVNDKTKAFVREHWNNRAERNCVPTEDGCCPYCGEDLVRCDVGVGELGGAIELDPPIYHNYCPNCGRKCI